LHLGVQRAMTDGMASRPLRIAGVTGWLVGKLFYTVWVALMIATPLFGFWLASSLAAYDNASLWLALVVGLLLFPLVPVGWELFSMWRRSRRGDIGKPILTRLDRLVLRTLIINGLFLGTVMWLAPHTAFRALAVRGDWILDGHDGAIASEARALLLGFADRFSKRWHRDDTTYGTSDKPPPPPVADTVDPLQPVPGVVLPIQPKDPNGWPLAEEPDPLVTAMPEAEQTSVAAVGRYFATQISDPKRLAKALHDYVVLRLQYDKPTANLEGADLSRRPSQEADDVFAARTGVCEGYARLYAALGKAAGLDVAFITGYIRDGARHPSEDATTDEQVKQALEGFLHAWNAVKIDGQWLLVDTTWDDPVSASGADHYSTTYLFTPPRVFAYDHLPEEAAWQLVARPMGTGEFARQPLLSPYVGRLGVVLQEPTRSQVTTSDGEVEVQIANPFHATLSVSVDPRAADPGLECTLVSGEELVAKYRCLVRAGQHEITLFGAPGAHATQLRSFGTILVNSR
jgi:transglutaminase-like putative cysteine protease